MKKIVFAIMALAALTSCKGLKVTYSSDKPMAEEHRALKDFERITLLGSLDVRYMQTDSFSVIVKGPVKAIKNVETEVEHNTLKVNMKNSKSIIHWGDEDMDDVTVYVTSPDFLGISLSGSGDFSCERKLDTDNLDITLRGSGDINFEDIICDRVKVSLVGSGDVAVDNVETQQAQLELIGSGDIKMNFTNSGKVNSRLMGSGDITLKGNVREMNNNVRGTGDIDTEDLVVK